MFVLSSPQATCGPEADALHQTVIYQAVAKHIITQCISAVLLLLHLVVVVVLFCSGLRIVTGCGSIGELLLLLLLFLFHISWLQAAIYGMYTSTRR
jgi:hypothetical protein